MNNEQTTKLFDHLIENLEHFLPILSQYGSHLIEEQNYQQAKEVILKAEWILSLKDRVKALRDEWINVNLTDTDDGNHSLEDRVKTTNEFNKMQQSELYTHNQAIKIPILQALVNLGGKAKRKDLFAELEKVMVEVFTDTDWKTIPSNDKITVWQCIAAHALQNLKKEGAMLNNASVGGWEITEKGRKLLQEYNNKGS